MMQACAPAGAPTARCPRRLLGRALLVLALAASLPAVGADAPAVDAATASPPVPAAAAEGGTPTAPNAAALPERDGQTVLQAFGAADQPNHATRDTADHTKRQVMFLLGAPLLLMLLVTAGLGIAVGVFGKPLFLLHMICAGLSVTLAVVHAIVGLVWFNPF